MNKNSNRKTGASIYLWKVVLIILALFVVFISIECFFLIERISHEGIIGLSKELETSITTDTEENEISELAGNSEIFEKGTIPGIEVSKYNIRTINMCKRRTGAGIIIYNNTGKDEATIRDLDLDKTITSQDDISVGLLNDRFKNFPAVIAEKYDNNGQNNFKVIKYIGPAEEYNNEFTKYNITIPKDGIVILFHDVDVETIDGSKTSLNIQEDDIIHVNFDYKIGSGYKADNYGEITVYRKQIGLGDITGKLVKQYDVKAINKSIENILGVSIFYNNKGNEAIQVKDINYNKDDEFAERKFRFFAAIIAEKVDTGDNNFKVTWMYGRNDFYQNDSSKTNLTIPENGVIIYFHDNDLVNFGEGQNYKPDIKLDDIIHVDFNYKDHNIDKTYNSDGYGKISVYRDDSNYPTVEVGYPVTEINYAKDNALGASIIYNKNKESIQVKDIDIKFESTDKFRYYSAIVAEKVTGNKFKVIQVINRDDSDIINKQKINITVPEDGIVIYFHDQDLNRFIGSMTTPNFTKNDILEVDFDYTQVLEGYNPAIYGYIKKAEKDNSYYEIHYINKLSNDDYSQKRANTYI